MRPSGRDKISILSFLILLIAAVLFLTVFSTTTSPLYPNNYGVDSAFNRVIGTSLIRGKTLYKDIWDNKGPVLFFIQALGALKGTRNTGVALTFLLQVLSLFLSLLFIMKAGRYLIPEGRKDLRFFLSALCALSVMSVTMEGGNLCEEWSLPFISCSLYLLMKYIVRASEDPRHPPKYAFLHGVCLAMIAFIRINNAVSICVGVLFIGILLVIKRQWKNLLSNLICGILGILTVFLPVLGYFYAKHALSDMIYAVFLYNLQYVGAESHRSFAGMDLALRYLPCAAAFLIILFGMIRARQLRMADLLILAVTAGNAVMLFQSNIYLHYFTVFIPVFLLVLVLYARLPGIPEMLAAAAVFAVFAAKDIRSYPDLRADHNREERFTSAADIPAEEKKSSIAVWLTPEIYLNTGFEPVSRYCAYQFVHFPVVPSMLDEFLSDIRTARPRWIIVLSGYEDIYPEIGTILEADYRMMFTEDNADFFRRNVPE